MGYVGVITHLLTFTNFLGHPSNLIFSSDQKLSMRRKWGLPDTWDFLKPMMETVIHQILRRNDLDEVVVQEVALLNISTHKNAYIWAIYNDLSPPVGHPKWWWKVREVSPKMALN